MHSCQPGPWALALRSASGPGNIFNVLDVASGIPPGAQNGWTYLESEFKRVTGSTASPTVTPLPSAASSLRLLARAPGGTCVFSFNTGVSQLAPRPFSGTGCTGAVTTLTLFNPTVRA